MKMNTTYAAIAFTLGLVSASNAALSLINGDFEAGSNWKSLNGTTADGWFSNLSLTKKNGAYGESITAENGVVYGSGRVTGLKDVAGAYIQQTIGLVGDTTGVKIDFLAGHRSHSSYTGAVPGTTTIKLKVSLWDATLDTELDSSILDYIYTADGVALQSESETLSYLSSNRN